MTVQWRKSSYSGGVQDEACIELASLHTEIGVRDSKNPHSGHLSLTHRQFGRLTESIKRKP
ncbi:DUF397 domain-containing protein [Actinocorallia longicatena]|uniref:DUF397 domain-containing protein n=1 Tax=Actinocorallia longicatena TaxID=111803 RepID=A0ABP6QEV6_9ACTN